MNVPDAREANINVVGNWRMPVSGDMNERAISLEEIGEAVNEMGSGKAPGAGLSKVFTTLYLIVYLVT